jgi:hypothetical protein
LQPVIGGKIPAARPNWRHAPAANPPRLSAERRRALELLDSSWGGATEALLVHGHGFSHQLLAGLVRAGLASAEQVVMNAGRPDDRGRSPADHGVGEEGD